MMILQAKWLKWINIFLPVLSLMILITVLTVCVTPAGVQQGGGEGVRGRPLFSENQKSTLTLEIRP